MKKNTKIDFKITLGKEIMTEHLPINIVEGIDAIIGPRGYSRLPQKRNDSDEFIWENDKKERFVATCYTRVNSIARSAIFDEDLSANQEGVSKRLMVLCNDLKSIIGDVSQGIGYPYVASSRELLLQIEGSGVAEKIKIITPIFREIYSEMEGVQFFDVSTLEQTRSSVQLLFSVRE